MQRKKRILINTDYPLLKTGLAKNGRHLAEFLYKHSEYEVFYYACGMVWENQEYNRLPYKVYGTMPQTKAEMDIISSKGEVAIRDCSYGLNYLDKVIQEVKPDVLISSNDTWASYNYLSKPWINKITFIPHKTYDSVPFLPDQVSYFDKAKKVYVWADFAVEEAKRLGKTNVEKLTGIIDPKNFKKIPLYKKLELRQRFGIPEDAFVVVMCSRNQIRKQFRSVLEGYSKWKKQFFPKAKTYVLFHTNFSEPGGWDFGRFLQQFDIPQNELLTTYVCKKCKEYHVSPFQGNDKNCPYCKAEKSFNNINIQDGASEEQLNEIYNISDCMVHGADAAGLEITVVEGLYCGLPLATNSYAALEMFAKQPFVTEITCTFGAQHGTQFNRAILNPNDIAKFLDKTYNKTRSLEGQAYLDKIGKEGREWALKNFSPNVVCAQWKKIIDESPLVDWDAINLEIKQEAAKDPLAKVDPIEDPVLWLKSLYKNILKMDVKDNDSGLLYWLGEIRKGSERANIEAYFRDVASKESNVVEVKPESMLLSNNKKHVLVVLKESIGDVIISTSVLPSLRQSYPAEKYNIYFATDQINHEILAGNLNIDKVLHYQPFMEGELNCVSHGNTKGLFDVYINLGIFTQRQLNYLTNDNISINL